MPKRPKCRHCGYHLVHLKGRTCRFCARKLQSAYRRAHPEKVAAWMRNYRAKCKERKLIALGLR